MVLLPVTVHVAGYLSVKCVQSHTVYLPAVAVGCSGSTDTHLCHAIALLAAAALPVCLSPAFCV